MAVSSDGSSAGVPSTSPSTAHTEPAQTDPSGDTALSADGSAAPIAGSDAAGAALTSSVSAGVEQHPVTVLPVFSEIFLNPSPLQMALSGGVWQLLL